MEECAVCRSIYGGAEPFPAAYSVQSILAPGVKIYLCQEHALDAQNSGVYTVTALKEPEANSPSLPPIVATD